MPILSLEQLLPLRETWRRDGLRLVLTNGVFDLLHIGHAAYLSEARNLGDILLVGLNSDASTQALKGPQRPLTPQRERAELLTALRPVDYVTIFEERTAENLVQVLQPDVYVKGGDYGGSDGMVDATRLPEARVVHGYGGQVLLLPYRQGRSTTELIQKIVALYGT
jgi:rfaE bifunctional protein nucleotidyltransferase chain/domain